MDFSKWKEQLNAKVYLNMGNRIMTNEVDNWTQHSYKLHW